MTTITISQNGDEIEVKATKYGVGFIMSAQEAYELAVALQCSLHQLVQPFKPVKIERVQPTIQVST